MAKTLTTLLKLKGKVDPSLQRALKQANSTTVKNAQKTSRKVQSTFAGMAKKAAAYVGAAFALRSLVNLGKAGIEVAQNRMVVEAKLTEVMHQRLNATDAQINKIKELAAAEGKTGVIGSTLQLSGGQMLGTFLKQSASLETLIPAMNDLAAQQKGVNATEEDMVNIGKMMGKVMYGQTGALKRAGIVFTAAEEKVMKYGNETEKAAMLAQVITNNVGNMNQALAKTDAGKMKQAQNKIAGMKREIGAKLIPIVAKASQWFLPFFEKMGNLLEKIIPILGRIFEQLAPIFNILGDALVFALTQLANLIGFLADVWDWLGKHKEIAIVLGVVIGGLTALIVAYKIQQLLAAAATALWTAISGGATAAATALGVAFRFLTGPIGIVILAIGALIAIGYLVVENWEVISKWLEGVWKGISDFFVGIWEGMVSVIKGAVNAVIDAINWIIGAYNDTIGAVGGAIGVNIKIQPIAHLAEGLSVTSPMLAMIGEAGPETVVPHNNKPRSRMLLREAAAGVGMPLGGNMFIYRPEITLPPGADEKAFKQVLDDDFERWKAFMAQYDEEEGRLAFV